MGQTWCRERAGHVPIGSFPSSKTSYPCPPGIKEVHERLLEPKLVETSINPACYKNTPGTQRPGIHKHTWIQVYSARTLEAGVSKSQLLARWYLLDNTVLCCHRKQALPAHLAQLSSMKPEVRGLWNSPAVPPSCCPPPRLPRCEVRLLADYELRPS